MNSVPSLYRKATGRTPLSGCTYLAGYNLDRHSRAKARRGAGRILQYSAHSNFNSMYVALAQFLEEHAFCFPPVFKPYENPSYWHVVLGRLNIPSPQSVRSISLHSSFLYLQAYFLPWRVLCQRCWTRARSSLFSQGEFVFIYLSIQQLITTFEFHEVNLLGEINKLNN